MTEPKLVTERTEAEEFTESENRSAPFHRKERKDRKGPTNSSMPTLSDRFCGCILGGAVGDAFGSAYEGRADVQHFSLASTQCGGITDDTQLSLATCEAIAEANRIDPAVIAAAFLRWFQRGDLRGLGSSVLKSLRDLEVGAPWYLAGASGDRSAGNGAAIRIAPIAFFISSDNPSFHETVRDVCRITHRHDEAYVGALAVVEFVSLALRDVPAEQILGELPQRLPDTVVRDRLIEADSRRHESIGAFAERFGCSGYVADSVPLAIFAASKIRQLGFERVIDEVVRAGGDTDSNASIAGQLCGAMLGATSVPAHLVDAIPDASEIRRVINLSLPRLR